MIRNMKGNREFYKLYNRGVNFYIYIKTIGEQENELRI